MTTTLDLSETILMYVVIQLHGAIVDPAMQNKIGFAAVKQIEKVSRRSLWGYMGDNYYPFLKLTILEPRNLPKVRDKRLSISSGVFI